MPTDSGLKTQEIRAHNAALRANAEPPFSTVGFWASRSEREALQRVADADELSVSAWLRRAVRELVRRRLRTLTSPALLAALESAKDEQP